jgi:recombination protein RecR
LAAVAVYTETVSRLIDEFAKLPGIGRKSAERLADYVLRATDQEALGLARAIEDVKRNVGRCKRCYNLAEGDECEICRDPRRDSSQVCVVEQPRDVIAMEKPGTYRGLYHVLGGRIAPLDGTGPDQLTIDALVRRVRAGEVKEVILATNPTLEGDGTALYISQQLADTGVELTRLARGLASGMVLEFANRDMLADALANRRKMQ